MSEYDDKTVSRTERLDRIREGRNKCYAKQTPAMINNLPQLHRDCYWLLELVEQYEDAMIDDDVKITAARIKMDGIMS